MLCATARSDNIFRKHEYKNCIVIEWKDLSRADRNVIQRLYGGGSLRNCDPAVASRLRQFGLIEGGKSRVRLSSLGQALIEHVHAELKERLGAS